MNVEHWQAICCPESLIVKWNFHNEWWLWALFHTLGSLAVFLCDVKWSEVAQWCPTLCNPMDYSLLGSSVHGIFQARVLEWVAISFSRGSSWPRDRTQVSHTVGRRYTIWATREVLPLWSAHLNLSHTFVERVVCSFLTASRELCLLWIGLFCQFKSFK